ncbi:ADP-ribosylglycohydrolase family protein [Zobellella maritima]|uniref:ADP-ribosylglycohydrolase family protein n=1 Tax=Zobellella maritima TaxID=2059725 RepID=UPI000E3083D2|nr:ADP-ribosylglycohydrolase family protein [Zobellella maritima]
MWNRDSCLPLLGVLVADAASLGLHWLYDRGRIADVVQREGGCVFLTPDAADYQDAAGYFGYPDKSSGDQSGYGETALLAAEVMAAEGGWNSAAYQRAFVRHFSAGGRYQGYIDRPTRALLETLQGPAEDWPLESGCDDEQTPALATVPALCACYPEPSDLALKVRDAAAVSHRLPEVQQAAQALAHSLNLLLRGAPLAQALQVMVDDLPGAWQERARAACEGRPGLDELAEQWGTGCALHESIPVSLALIRRADSYSRAITDNILLGGDSCGRALLVGALAAAHWGVGEKGIPVGWLLRLNEHQRIARLLGRLTPLHK